LISEVPAGVGEHDFFSGLTLPAGSESRRDLDSVTNTSMETLSKLAQKRRNIRALIDHTAKGDHRGVEWLAQVEDLTRGLGAAASGEVLYQLAQSYQSARRSDLAAEVLGLLVERLPDHALADTALMWLLHYYSSGEVATWQGESPHARAHFLASHGRAGSSVGSTGPDVAARDREGAVPATFPRSPAANRQVRRTPMDRVSHAASLGQFIRQTRPALFAEPAIQFPMAATERRRTKSPADAMYQGLLQSQLPVEWRDCAKGEVWLATGKGRPPKATLECRSTKQRPRLDGVMEEPLWQDAEPADLTSVLSDDAEWPAQVRVIYDADFLFLGIRCRKASAAVYSTTEQERPRDADLQAHDRVELLLDVDRDYATYFHLSVDHRGWAGESCMGDPSWNPKWYVAGRSDTTEWTAEAAISWKDLTPGKPGPPSVWAMGIQRVVPHVGFQSWSKPAAVRVMPQGFGYLLFR